MTYLYVLAFLWGTIGLALAFIGFLLVNFTKD